MVQALGAVREALDPAVHGAALEHLQAISSGGKLVDRLTSLAGMAVAAGYNGVSPR